MRFINTSSMGYPTGMVSEKVAGLKSLNISMDDAKNTAEELVSQLGLSSFIVSAIGSMPDGEIHPNIEAYDDIPKCYVFYFTRAIGGIPETYISTNIPIDITGEKPVLHTENWPDERVEVCVDDRGVTALTFFSPMKVLKTLNQNVSLKPFTEIMDRFKTQMQLGGAWRKDDTILSRRVYINKIVLGYARIRDKDHTDEYLMVPVWDFFGYDVKKYAEGIGDEGQLDENNEFVEKDNFGRSYLTINAIDGSIIDRALGY